MLFHHTQAINCDEGLDLTSRSASIHYSLPIMYSVLTPQLPQRVDTRGVCLLKPCLPPLKPSQVPAVTNQQDPRKKKRKKAQLHNRPNNLPSQTPPIRSPKPHPLRTRNPLLNNKHLSPVRSQHSHPRRLGPAQSQHGLQ